MKITDLYAWIALIIVIVGGINWGLVGLARLDLIGSIFGFGLFGRLIYIIVGIAAAYLCYLIYEEKYKKPPPATP